MELMILWFGREKELTSFKICLFFFSLKFSIS